jgi:hypothetical protein
MGAFLWFVMWGCVAIVAVLALVLGGIAIWARLSREQWATDPYIGALDPTLWDAEAHHHGQTEDRPAREPSGSRKTLASNLNFSGASERHNG